MSGETELSVAIAGDAMTQADLQTSIDWLLEQAAALTLEASKATEFAVVQEINQMHHAVMQKVADLTVQRIDLLVGEAKISATHLQSAIDYAQAVVKQITHWKTMLTKIGNVLDFFAAVLTGNGKTIVQAAVSLKRALDKA